jgi:hypothetical protein
MTRVLPIVPFNYAVRYVNKLFCRAIGGIQFDELTFLHEVHAVTFLMSLSRHVNVF